MNNITPNTKKTHWTRIQPALLPNGNVLMRYVNNGLNMEITCIPAEGKGLFTIKKLDSNEEIGASRSFIYAKRIAKKFS